MPPIMSGVLTSCLYRCQKEIYLKNYGGVEEAVVGLGNYFDKYNHYRSHQSLDYFTPAQVYFDNLKLEAAVILP